VQATNKGPGLLRSLFAHGFAHGQETGKPVPGSFLEFDPGYSSGDGLDGVLDCLPEIGMTSPRRDQEDTNMSIQYVQDQTGKKTAVLVPIRDWEIIQDLRAGDPEDTLTPQEAARAEEADKEYQRGEFQSLEDVRRELLGQGHE
jgi:hypothetical protein